MLDSLHCFGERAEHEDKAISVTVLHESKCLNVKSRNIS